MGLISTITVLMVAAASAEPAAKDEALQLAGKVHVIFDQKCNECHGGHLKKPEGGFGYVLDLQRMADNSEYVERGKPAESELFRLVDEEDMPPNDNPKTPALTKAEKDSVNRWILAGAPSALPPNQPRTTTPTARPPLSSASETTAWVSPKNLAMKTALTLDVKAQSAAEVFAQIAKQSGIRVDYTRPKHEPKLSMNLKGGTVLEALEYLVLCGNFSLSFNDEAALVGVNPPPLPPAPTKLGKGPDL
jgi:mono/diheme cytochrome c family protein